VTVLDAPTVAAARIELVHAPVSPKTIWSFVELTCADGSRGLGEATLMRYAAALNLGGLDLRRV
jgi:hypothetical protein